METGLLDAGGGPGNEEVEAHGAAGGVTSAASSGEELVGEL